jgi:hypothetical protein
MSEDRGSELNELTKERRKQLSDRAKARLIVQEILNFGVNDSQVREIVRQLALELEDREVMLKIYEFLGSAEDGEQEVKVYT